MSSRPRTKRNQKQALNRFPANTSTARRVPSHLNLSLKELNGSGQGTNYLLKHSQAPTSTVNLEHFGEGPIKRNKIGSPAEAGEFGDRTVPDARHSDDLPLPKRRTTAKKETSLPVALYAFKIKWLKEMEMGEKEVVVK
ncbi:hypothetical protein QE152_g13771 [Popillia japonica]|uniref:Uncharacterized protein n=1 Tax=Popillia japonica TaxID=7064 RepID=A0AAW1LBC1_POPJA